MKTIIAIDDSCCSRHALQSVFEREWPANSLFKILHTVEPLALQYGLVAPQAIELMLDAERRLKKHGQVIIDAAVIRLRVKFGIDQVSGAVLNGQVCEAIVEEAAQWPADLIVIGSHGRTGAERLLLGSVAEQVAHRAPCTVEIVKLTAAQKKCSLKQDHDASRAQQPACDHRQLAY